MYGLAALMRPVNKNKINKASMAINDVMDPLYILKADEVSSEEEEKDKVDDLEEEDEEDDEEDDEEEEETV